MTVHLRFGGQAFRPEMMEKVRRAKEWRDAHGGIKPETAHLSIENGANILVAGTSIFRAPDYGERFANSAGAQWSDGVME